MAAESLRALNSKALTGIKDKVAGAHVVYHSYPTAQGIETFTGKEDYSSLVRQWKQTGVDPKIGKDRMFRMSEKKLAPGESLSLIDVYEGGVINSLKLYMAGMNPDRLQDVWIRMKWDNHEREDVLCPIGCFFGNSLGYNNTRYLLMGSDRQTVGFIIISLLPFGNEPSDVGE